MTIEEWYERAILVFVFNFLHLASFGWPVTVSFGRFRRVINIHALNQSVWYQGGNTGIKDIGTWLFEPSGAVSSSGSKASIVSSDKQSSTRMFNMANSRDADFRPSRWR